MTLEEFCLAFELPEAVTSALREQEIDGPDVLSQFPFELYRQPQSQDGLNLKMGPAYRLKKAVIAWKQGYTSKAEADQGRASDGRADGDFTI